MTIYFVLVLGYGTGRIYRRPILIIKEYTHLLESRMDNENIENRVNH